MHSATSQTLSERHSVFVRTMELHVLVAARVVSVVVPTPEETRDLECSVRRPVKMLPWASMHFTEGYAVIGQHLNIKNMPGLLKTHV